MSEGIRPERTVRDFQPSHHQNVANGVLRTACFAIEDTDRQLQNHLICQNLSREDLTKKREKITKARLAALDAMQGLWDLVTTEF